MARSVWKGPFVDGYLLKKADTARSSGRHEMIRIWSRRSTILPQFVGLTFGVYNGILRPYVRSQGQTRQRAKRRIGCRTRRAGSACRRHVVRRGEVLS